MPVAAAAVLAADQITKSLALSLIPNGSRREILGSVVGLRVSTNPGGIFGFLPDAGVLFLILTVIIVVVVAIWALRTGESPVLFGIVVGGGLGNLADRVFREPAFLRGRVVDFIDLSFWPTFNVADAAISIGVLLLLLQGFRTKRG